MTRQDYMEGRVTHHEYYSVLAKEAGISFENSDMLPRIKRALAAGDEHLNTIPLGHWDMMALAGKPAITEALRAHEDGWSLAGGVCTLKAAAKNAAMAEVSK